MGRGPSPGPTGCLRSCPQSCRRVPSRDRLIAVIFKSSRASAAAALVDLALRGKVLVQPGLRYSRYPAVVRPPARRSRQPLAPVRRPCQRQNILRALSSGRHIDLRPLDCTVAWPRQAVAESYPGLGKRSRAGWIGKDRALNWPSNGAEIRSRPALSMNLRRFRQGKAISRQTGH